MNKKILLNKNRVTAWIEFAIKKSYCHTHLANGHLCQSIYSKKNCGKCWVASLKSDYEPIERNK